MAYFDDPERAAEWQRELDGLRAERLRRQGKEPPAQADPGDLAAVSGARKSGPGAGRSPVREEITLEQLEAEAGVARAPVASAPKGPVRQKELSLDREMN